MVECASLAEQYFFYAYSTFKNYPRTHFSFGLFRSANDDDDADVVNAGLYNYTS